MFVSLEICVFENNYYTLYGLVHTSYNKKTKNQPAFMNDQT